MSKGKAISEALAKLNTSLGSDKRRHEDMMDTESKKVNLCWHKSSSSSASFQQVCVMPCQRMQSA